MSYQANISFKRIDMVDVPDFFKELKKVCIDRLIEIAKDDWPFCPLCKSHPFKKEDEFGSVVFGNNRKEFAKYEESISWAERVFSWRWGYDHDFGLLYLFGVPYALFDQFDGNVYFQNSTDQDYEKEEWCGIPEFEAVFNKWMSMPKSDFLEKIELDSPDYFDEEDKNDEDHLNYVRRAKCYEEIWSHFSDALYDDDSVTYISMFRGIYDSIHTKKVVSACFYEAKKELFNNIDIEEKSNE